MEIGIDGCDLRLVDDGGAGGLGKYDLRGDLARSCLLKDAVLELGIDEQMLFGSLLTVILIEFCGTATAIVGLKPKRFNLLFCVVVCINLEFCAQNDDDEDDSKVFKELVQLVCCVGCFACVDIVVIKFTKLLHSNSL